MNQPTSRPGAVPPLAVPGKLARRGFTLVELLVVMAIIGIILSLVLIAGMDAANRANECATQSLITKLEQGLSDRLEALLQNQPLPNYTHGYLAAIYGSNYQLPSLALQNTNNTQPNPQVTQTQRAQVIALYDYIKAEIPDVFYVQSTSPGTSGYPLNFAGVPIMGTDALNYILPLGNSSPGPYPNGYGDFNTLNTSLTTGPVSNPTLGFAGSGIYGAAYEVAAGVYKGLGYLPAGYDGVDNDGDGYIDNWGEGVGGTGSVLATQITVRLQNHTHATARAEMLYAILVSGTGPLGSVYSPDDFTDREVQDTDGDGMPEFIDAWGKPLQFFRWPLFYHSDLQRGQVILPDATVAGQYDLWPPYSDPSNPANTTFGMFQEREQDPLDVNQQLVAPGWWSSVGAGGIAANTNFPFTTFFPSATLPTLPTNAGTCGPSVAAFQALFHTLCEPCPTLSPPGQGAQWDRGGNYGYRAFYSKFLILSGGQDQAPGVFLYSDAVLNANLTTASQMLIANENNAMPFALDVGNFTGTFQLSTTTIPNNPGSDPTTPTSYDLQQNAQDDISNHNLLAGGAIGGSG